MLEYLIIAHFGVHTAELGRSSSLDQAIQYAMALASALDATGRYEHVRGTPDIIMVVQPNADDEPDALLFCQATGGYADALHSLKRHDMLGPKITARA